VVVAYRAALEEFRRDQVPLQWATTQNNLGNALETLGERESGTARLEEAVAAYRAALAERTRDRVPLQWATTQNNLGAALEILGERESGTARLEEAIAAYRAALEEYTRDRVPLDWAMSRGNQGIALMLLARLKDIQYRCENPSSIKITIELSNNPSWLQIILACRIYLRDHCRREPATDAYRSSALSVRFGLLQSRSADRTQQRSYSGGKAYAAKEAGSTRRNENGSSDGLPTIGPTLLLDGLRKLGISNKSKLRIYGR
jgi:tetratricopeptide (TPR) repeat protein